MSSIDDRIVSIKFDNAEFESKISATLASLDKLTEKVNTVGAGKGFSDINAAANSVNLAPIAAGVDNISSKFGAMGAIAFTALQNITTSVMSVAKSFVQTDILAPLIGGGKERAQNIEQAKFQFAGLGMDVNTVMANAKTAVLGTAYGLGDAAKAAAQFGASGIKTGDDMVQSLQAIAGMAAMTGTSYSDMAYLFTTSAASGKITNMDLQQFATRGINAAAAYGKATGQTEAQVHAMATAGTLDYKSFAKAMDDTFGAHATMANQTYSGSLDNMHAAMSRLSATYFTPEMVQQRDLFNALTPVIDNVSSALQPLITEFIGIRGVLSGGLIEKLNKVDLSSFSFAMPNFAEGIENAFNGVTEFLGTIKSAFREIFPPSATSTLLAFSIDFKNFTESLKMGAETADKVKSIFAGFFAVVSIGWAILKGIVSVIGDVVNALSPAGSSFLNAGAGIGDFLTKAKQVLVDGGVIQEFFTKLGEVIVVPIAFLSDLSSKIVDFFTSVGAGSTDKVSARFQSIGDAADKAGSAWDSVMAHLQGVFNVLDTIWGYISDWFSQLGSKIAAQLKPADFNSALDIINVGLLGGITAMLSKFMSGGVKFGFGGGIFTKVKSTLTGVTRTLQTMQTTLKAKALLEIAAAMGILTISIIALSLINSADLTKSLAAISVGFGELFGMMVLMDKTVANTGAAAKLMILGLALTELAAALVVLSIAIKIMSSMSWEELVKGLAGVGVGLGLMVVAVNLMPDSEGMIRAGLSMMAIALALLVLSEAVKSFGSMSWTELGKGLAGIAVGLGLMVLAMNAMPPTGLLTGLAFVAIAAGLLVLAQAVQAFGSMSWDTMAKGLLGLAVSLAAITVAMNFMPPDLPATAIGVLLLSAAMLVMADAVNAMGSNDWGTLAKGLGAFAVMLGVLVVAMNLMNGSITGAAALLIVSGAMLVMADVLEKLGGMSIKEIAIGIGAVAAVLLVIGVAGYLLAPVVPALLGLGIALALIAGSFALFGVGAMLVVTAISMLAAVGPAAAKAFVASLDIIIKAIPKLAAAAALFVVSFAEELLKAAPLLLTLMTTVLEQLLETVIKLAPEIGKAFEAIVTVACKVLRDKFPDIVTTGLDMLIALLQGISDNIGQIVDVGTQLITNLVTSLVNNMPQLVTAATNLIVSFLTELSNHVGELVTAGTNLLVNFLLGIANNISKVVDAVANIITSFITAIGDAALQIAAAGANALINFINGMGTKINDVVTAGVNVMISFIQGLGQNAVRLANAAGQALVNFLNGLADAINTYAPQIRAAGVRVGEALINGIVPGFTNKIGDVVSWLGGLAGNVAGWVGYLGGALLQAGKDVVHGLGNGIIAAKNWILGVLADMVSWIPGPIKKALGLSSPSKLFRGFGINIVEGLVLGIRSMEPSVNNAANSLANNVASAFNTDTINSAISEMTDQLSNLDEFNPVITPVLDLTKVQSESSKIAGYMGVSAITPDTSLQQARLISTATNLANASNTAPVAPAPTEVTFTQTITSPAALSTNDIYRNTRNQITLAKEELGII